MLTEEKALIGTFPTVALRGLVQFPNMLLTLDVGRKKIRACNKRRNGQKFTCVFNNPKGHGS